MITPQSPALQVFVSVQAVLAGDMTLQHLPPVAAIKANYILVTHRLPYRYGGSPDLLGLNTLSKAHPVVPGWSICSIRVTCAGDLRRARGCTWWLGRDR